MSQRNAVYTGVVVKPTDPKKLGRVRVSLPSFGEELWARRATLAAGDGRGTWFVPDVGDEVLGTGSVEVTDSNGNVVTLASSGVTVTAASKVAVTAGTVEIDAAMINVDAGMAKFNGVVQCDTLIANSVVASSYTPGVGNIR